MRSSPGLTLLMVLGCLLVGCSWATGPADLPTVSGPTAIPATATATITFTPFPSFTFTPSPSFTPTFTITPTWTASPTLEPVGCLRPPDDYTRITVNGWVLNRRTFAMLQHAADLYGGELEITGYAITQGSYHDNGAASFGTHLGGGAVDLSVMRKGTYTVLPGEVRKLLPALRVAGFAAWYRIADELYPGSPYHIHAIAIGDKELSQPAQDQLTGPAGYFRGFSGIPPQPGQAPTPDRFGGPILCQWMIDLGYQDLR
jgi:hypothetical protein